MSKASMERWPGLLEGPCVCSTLRRVARQVTSRYEAALADAGISVTQYALLVRVGRADGIVHSALADSMGMDRTTLSRDIRPLLRKGFVTEERAEDRRQRILRLTDSGRARVEQAYRGWSSIQRSMIRQLGRQEWQDLQSLLARLA